VLNSTGGCIWPGGLGERNVVPGLVFHCSGHSDILRNAQLLEEPWVCCAVMGLCDEELPGNRLTQKIGYGSHLVYIVSELHSSTTLSMRFVLGVETGVLCMLGKYLSALFPSSQDSDGSSVIPCLSDEELTPRKFIPTADDRRSLA
ncbi:hypothetical protein STEG23_003340, partial [Scotinomys teguina]